ncbi:MAG: hypothetical protein EAZ97_16055 [Bacteroidetes bacterium]|nr:MAG: hypothetical protein EAZ97_16055 [Bacteroidota bacterium]
MKILFRYFFFLLQIICSNDLFGQEDYLRFDHYTIENKISQNDIYCITQSKQGFLWFGTQDGLNKYNGYKFSVYEYEPSDSYSLSDGNITALLEDSKGVFWIGTKNGGLNRLDRATDRFASFEFSDKNPESISSNEVKCLLEDQEGNLWIGTANGLNKMDRKSRSNKTRFVIYKNDQNIETSLPNNMITSLMEDKEGNIWVGTEKGLAFLAKTKKEIPIFKNYFQQEKNENALSNDAIRSIYQDKKGNVWIGTKDGLNLFQKQINGFKVIKNDPLNPKSISGNDISATLEDQTGTFWVATRNNGLNMLDRNDYTAKIFRHSPRHSHTLSHDDVVSLFEDRSGTLWVGTLNGGLNKLNKRIKPFVYYDPNPGKLNALGHSFSRGVYKDVEGNIWIGTASGGGEGGGLKKFDKKVEDIISYVHDPKNPNSISSNAIWTIYPENGVLWLGTNKGLSKLDLKTQKFKNYLNDPTNPNSISHNLVYDIFRDQDSTFWIATLGGGLNRLIFDKEELVRVVVHKNIPQNSNSLSSNEVTDIFKDREGIIWIGTRDGFNKFDQKRGSFKQYKHQVDNLNSLSHNNINSITEDKDGNLLICTYGGGINIFNKKTEKFDYITEIDGLPNNVVYGILFDKKGNWWMSTNKGIASYDPKNLKFTSYAMRDGLQSNEFNRKSFHRAFDGELFFGGVNGVNAFYPERIKINHYKPDIVITEFFLYNEKVQISNDSIVSPLKEHIDLTEEIVLNYKQNFFAFEFASLHFDIPEKNQYAYKMEGLDEHWIKADVEKRFASYTNVPAGEYVFRVKASNSDGIWNEKGKGIRIIVTPPFYRTYLFYILSFLTIIGGGYGFLKSREMRIRMRSEELEKIVTERTSELLQKQEEINLKKKELEDKNKKMTGSINYAKRIQDAMLPLPEKILAALPESFIFFKPKDVVSGDFYWYEEKYGKLIIAAVDCTGHGVPGAFMSLIGSSLLDEIIISRGITKPNEILDNLHIDIRTSLKQQATQNRDGMDIAICVIDKSRKILEYAGARNPLLYIQNNPETQKPEPKILKPDKMSIGGQNDNKGFTLKQIDISEPTCFYLFSDGFQDQFSVKAKKYTSTRFQQLLFEIHEKPCEEQKLLLETTLKHWIGNTNQIDDILVIGVKI